MRTHDVVDHLRRVGRVEAACGLLGVESLALKRAHERRKSALDGVRARRAVTERAAQAVGRLH